MLATANDMEDTFNEVFDTIFQTANEKVTVNIIARQSVKK